MELSIELTNEHVYVTEYRERPGKMFINKTMKEKIPEGSYQNGIIVNTNGVAGVIRELLKENRVHSKRAVICVAANDIMQKELAVPRAKPKELRGIIENELIRQDMLTGEYVADYQLLKSDDEQLLNVNVYLMPKALIQNYSQTLKKAGLIPIRIEPVDNAMKNIRELLGLQEEEKLTFLVNVTKQEIHLLMLYGSAKPLYRSFSLKMEDDIEENIFIVSAVQKIRAALDENGQISERLVEEISKLVQFQSQKTRGKSQGQILIYGELAENEDFLEQVELGTGLPVQKCSIRNAKIVFKSGTEEIAGYHTIGAAGGAVLKETKALSFFQVLEEKRAGRFSGPDYAPLAAGLAVVFIISAAYAVSCIINMNMEQNISGYKDSIAEAKAAEGYREKVSMQQEVEALKQYNDICSQYIEILEGVKRIEPSVFSDVDKIVPEGVEILSYGFNNGEVIFVCRGINQDKPAEFAKIVTDAGLFETVIYEGFSAGMNWESEPYYNFQLECPLKQQEEQP